MSALRHSVSVNLTTSRQNLPVMQFYPISNFMNHVCYQTSKRLITKTIKVTQTLYMSGILPIGGILYPLLYLRLLKFDYFSSIVTFLFFFCKAKRFLLCNVLKYNTNIDYSSRNKANAFNQYLRKLLLK